MKYLLILLTLLFLNSCIPAGNGFKYCIENGSDADFTNSFEVLPNGVKYQDERGNQVIRSGTYKITFLK